MQDRLFAGDARGGGGGARDDDDASLLGPPADAHFHDAGCDAFCTGAAFAQFAACAEGRAAISIWSEERSLLAVPQVGPG